MTPSPDLRLFLIRHGETRSNRELRFIGTGDDPLTEHGRRQAEDLAGALSGLPIDALLTSPLRRTAETAAAVGRKLPLPVIPDPRLREQDYGDWEGLTLREIQALDGEDPGRFERWLRDPASAPRGGEALVEVEARVGSLVRELTSRHSGGSVVLVSHVGPIKVLLCNALGLPLAESLRLFLDPGTLSVVDWSDRPMLRLFNAQPGTALQEARWLARTSG